MRKSSCPAVLIAGPENRRYFSGFSPTDPTLVESVGALFVTLDRQFLLSDSRYVLAAEREAVGFEFVLVKGGGLGAALAELPKAKEGFFFEPNYLTVAGLNGLTAAIKGPLKPLPFDPSSLRAVKSAAELALIKKALRITEKAIGQLWESLEPGWTEARAAFFLDRTFRELGAEGSAFETIVASGPQAALPHASPGEKTIQNGEAVVIDCGARYQGYAADITRTMIVGSPKGWQKKIYRAVREAQLKAIEAIRPGARSCDVDQAARGHIQKAGYGRHFNHGLGHGVGLAVHEAPSLSARNKEPLTPGNVVTVEPGIYLPGRGGVRLEQLVVVTKNGHGLLNGDGHFYDF
jgi:Xaa-Pro aminopeptidase